METTITERTSPTTRREAIESLRNNVAHVRLVTHGFRSIRVQALDEINDIIRDIRESPDMTGEELTDAMIEGQRIAADAESRCRRS